MMVVSGVEYGFGNCVVILVFFGAFMQVGGFSLCFPTCYLFSLGGGFAVGPDLFRRFAVSSLLGGLPLVWCRGLVYVFCHFGSVHGRGGHLFFYGDFCDER